MHKVDPLARQVGKSSEVLGRREPLRLEAAHLTRRSRTALRRFAADNPAHSRIMAQTLGVVHILVSGKPDQIPTAGPTRQRVPPILATACVGSPAISAIPIHPLGAPWPPRAIQNKMLIAISESRRPRPNSVRYPVNAGYKPLA